jgi:hypothetical protein
MKTLLELVNIIGEAMTGINLQTGIAQERHGVADYVGANDAVLKISAHATAAGLANQEILDGYVTAPPPAAGSGITFPFLMDNWLWPNQAELDAHIARIAARNRALDDWQANVNVPGVGFPIWDTATVNSILARWDAAPTEFLKWNFLSQAEYFALQNRGWTVHQLATKINQYNGGGAAGA